MDRGHVLPKPEGSRDFKPFRRGSEGPSGQILMPQRGAPLSPRRSLFCLTIALLSLAPTLAFADELRFPTLTGRVVDEAGVLTTATRDAITQSLAEHER